MIWTTRDRHKKRRPDPFPAGPGSAGFVTLAFGGQELAGCGFSTLPMLSSPGCTRRTHIWPSGLVPERQQTVGAARVALRAWAITQPASGLHARPCARCRAWCRLHAGAITYSVPQAESTKLSTPGGKRTARFLLFLLFSFLHLGFSFLTAPYNTCSNRRIKVQELSRGELCSSCQPLLF